MACFGKQHGGQVVPGPLLVSCCHSPELFDFAEETPHAVALGVEVPVLIPQHLPVRLGGNHGNPASLGDKVKDGVAVMGPVGDGIGCVRGPVRVGQADARSAQVRRSRSRALARTIGRRIIATRATLWHLPHSCNRSQVALMSGFQAFADVAASSFS